MQPRAGNKANQEGGKKRKTQKEGWEGEAGATIYLLGFVLLKLFSEYKLEAYRLLLVKCYDIKMVYSPFNWIIPPLIQPKVATQQKQKNLQLNFYSF